MARGVSINIGVNTLEPGFYKKFFDLGFNSLNSAILDAETMADLAGNTNPKFEVYNDNHGYPVFAGNNPTADDVIKSLKSFSDTNSTGRLKSGDFLLITFSGHGMKVTFDNDNSSFGELPDNNTIIPPDVAWCLYDRPLLDDELTDALSDFEAGVRILVISDSCHSGTVIDHLNGLGIAKSVLDSIKAQGFNTEVFERVVLKAKIGQESFIGADRLILENNLAILNQEDIKIIRQTKLEELQQREFLDVFSNSLLDTVLIEKKISKIKIHSILKDFKNSSFNTKLNFTNSNKDLKKLIKSDKNILAKLPEFDFQVTALPDISINKLAEIPLIKDAKIIPVDTAKEIFKDNESVFQEKRAIARTSINAKLKKSNNLFKADIILLSACKDMEDNEDSGTTLDGRNNKFCSDYTCAVLRVWRKGHTNYSDFQTSLEAEFANNQSIKCDGDRVRHTQKPQIEPKTGSFLADKPFQI
jgi:Caspase domain